MPLKPQFALGLFATRLFANTLPVTLLLTLPAAAQAFSFDYTYVFGDSLSDTGNLYQITGGLLPPSPPYAQRLSNGPVWVEYLAPKLGTPLTSFAIAGANTGTNNTTIPLPTGIQSQIGAFTLANPQADPNALYIVFGGANDYLGGKQTDPTIPVGNLQSAIASLAGIGARNILVANLPDLGKLPGTRGNAVQSQGLTLLSSAHNSLLAQTLGLLGASLGSQVNLIPLDIASLFADAQANPAKYGFTNVQDSCLFPPPLLNPGTIPTICSNPSQFLFWDDIHPTTAGHVQIADFAFATLQSSAVPEPSVTLGALACGAFLGGAAMRKRKQRQQAQLFAETIARPTKQPQAKI